MRKFLLFIVMIVAATGQSTAQKIDTDTVSVAIATLFGNTLRDNLENTRAAGVEINDSLFAYRFVLALQGKSTGMSTERAQAVMQSVFNSLEANDTADAAEQVACLAAARNTKGAVVLPSGTVFIVITEGKGTKPAAADTAVVTYRGQLADGTVFDVADEPIELPVGHLVRGFSEGLQQMLPGGTYRLVIPASAAYGPEGIPGAIPGGAALDFTVTFIGVKH